MQPPFYAVALLLLVALLLESRGGANAQLAPAASDGTFKLSITNYDALVQGAESMFRDRAAGVGDSWEAVAAAFETALHSAGTGGVVRGVEQSGNDGKDGRVLSSPSSSSSLSLSLSSSSAGAGGKPPSPTSLYLPLSLPLPLPLCLDLVFIYLSTCLALSPSVASI